MSGYPQQPPRQITPTMAPFQRVMPQPIGQPQQFVGMLPAPMMGAAVPIAYTTGAPVVMQPAGTVPYMAGMAYQPMQPQPMPMGVVYPHQMQLQQRQPLPVRPAPVAMQPHQAQQQRVIGATHMMAHHQQMPPTAAPVAVVDNKPPVAISWVRAVANGALSFDGNTLASCIDDTQLPNFLTLPASLRQMATPNSTTTTLSEAQKRQAAADELTTFAGWVRNALTSEAKTIGAQRGMGEEVIGSAARHLEPFIHIAISVFVLHAAKLLQAPEAALDGAVVALAAPPRRIKGKKNKNRSATATTDGATADPAEAASLLLEGCTTDTRNTYLRALLTAFDNLQELHMQRRSIKAFNGFPGWDTAVVISFVHVIQNVSQTIDAFEDEVMGDLIRNWRKLFVFLQTSDPEVPKEKSRRRGALAVVNSLLILLFQHDNTHQCRIILNTIETAEKLAESQKDPLKSIISSSSHLTAEMIKFRYYQGRVRLYDRNFEGAFAAFSEASRLLPPIPVNTNTYSKAGSASSSSASADSNHPLVWGTYTGNVPTNPNLPTPVPKGMNAAQRDNKLRITFYQIVSAILCGLRVPNEVLAADPTAASVFKPLITAIQNGSPAAYTMALDIHGTYLRLRGVYMILQHARVYCYLTLLQRVHSAVTAAEKDNSMIPIPLLVKSLAAANHGCCDEDSKGFLFGDAKAAEDHSDAKMKAGSSSAAEHDASATAAEAAAAAEGLCTSDAYRLVKKLRIDVNPAFEADDIFMWMARLIGKGMARGYLSYEHQMLVLSKKEPFPPLPYTFQLI